MKKILTLFFVCIALTSQAQMHFFSTNGKDIRLKHASKAAENKIILYLNEKEVPENAERIGVLIGDYKKRDKAFEAAKSFAAQAKGDAILFVDGKDMTTSDKALNTLVGTNIKGSYNFYVYRLKKSWEMKSDQREWRLLFRIQPVF